MEQTPQEQFDALVDKLGAEAIIGAIKGHAQTDAGGACPQTPCKKGYICANGNCVLDIG